MPLQVMRHAADRVLCCGSMQPADIAATSQQWDTIRAQIAQGMLEHEILVQALRAQAIVSAMCILTTGGLAFFLWRRNGYLFEAFVAEIKRHSFERITLVKQHSLEQSSLMMQMLHAFEGIASRRRSTSATSPVSSGSAPTPRQPSTTSPTPPPMPSPPMPPTPIAKRRPQ